jgi:hypothetical protein
MALLAFQDLRCDVVRGTAYGSLTFPIELELSCKTEVSNLYLHLIVQEQVTQLQVSVYDSVAVEILHCRTKLVEVALHLQLMKSLSTSQQFVQRLVVAKFQQYVDVFSIFEEVLKPHDVVVMQTPVNLDLTHQLLLGSALCQGGLSNDFGG